MYHANVIVNSIVEYVTLFKAGITINVEMSVIILKNIMRAKNIIFGILLWLQKW